MDIPQFSQCHACRRFAYIAAAAVCLACNAVQPTGHEIQLRPTAESSIGQVVQIAPRPTATAYYRAASAHRPEVIADDPLHDHLEYSPSPSPWVPYVVTGAPYVGYPPAGSQDPGPHLPESYYLTNVPDPPIIGTAPTTRVGPQGIESITYGYGCEDGEQRWV